MSLPRLMTTRRFFLHNAKLVGIVMGGAFLAAGQDTGDPFETLPKSVWARARNNGLVMIHRPAPATLSSQATIVPPREPGNPLTVEGQVSCLSSCNSTVALQHPLMQRSAFQSFS
jgi:hypothetical protein